MPLSEAQKKQIEQKYQQGMIGKQHLEIYVRSGKITSVEEFNGYNENLVKTLKSIFASQPNQQEIADWKAIVPLLGKPSDELKSRLLSYINRWESLLPNGNHVTEAREHLANIDKDREAAEWNELLPLLGTTNEELKLRLQSFIGHWPNSDHVAEAQQHLANFDQQKEQEEWDRVDKFSISSMINFLTKYPYSTHINEIDDQVWNLCAPNFFSTDLRDRLNQYHYHFPQGNHINEAYNIVCSLDEWENVRNSKDLTTIHQFVNMRPESPFINDAKMLEFQQKQEELELMKKQFNEYDIRKLLYFINEHIFTTNELIEHGVATERSIEILMDIEKIIDSLPPIEDVIVKCEPICYENHTDIYMFGIPGTGKSCVLAGMVHSKDSPLSYNSVLSGGRYADAMVQYLSQGMPPPPTKMNYLTTIKGSMIDSKGYTHDCNLVEMAGEEFAFHIADNENNQVSFDDMGTGVTELLANNNGKLFFIVVDPTKENITFNKLVLVQNEQGEIVPDTRRVRVNQRQCLNRMVDLFTLPENEHIMKNVEGIHFIITKADTFKCLAHERDQYAANFFTNEYRDVYRKLTDFCREHNINAHKDKTLNGKPTIYTFSLGQFYVGNIVEFNDHDSLKIINAIINNTWPVNKKSFWDKFKAMFN